MGFSQDTTSKRSLDNLIDDYATILTNNLWVGYDYTHYGTAYLIDGVPKTFLTSTSKDYKEVLTDDTLDSNSFFYPKVKKKGDPYNANDYNQEIDLIFSVNLNKVYPTLSYRAQENAISDAFRVVNEMTALDIQSVVPGQDAISDFEADVKHNQPYCLFKFECILNHVIF